MPPVDYTLNLTYARAVSNGFCLRCHGEQGKRILALSGAGAKARRQAEGLFKRFRSGPSMAGETRPPHSIHTDPRPAPGGDVVG